MCTESVACHVAKQKRIEPNFRTLVEILESFQTQHRRQHRDVARRDCWLNQGPEFVGVVLRVGIGNFRRKLRWVVAGAEQGWWVATCWITGDLKPSDARLAVVARIFCLVWHSARHRAGSRCCRLVHLRRAVARRIGGGGARPTQGAHGCTGRALWASWNQWLGGGFGRHTGCIKRRT